MTFKMRFTFIATASLVLTLSIMWTVYKHKKQFYPTVVYLSNSQAFFYSMLALYLAAKFAVLLFFGRLQQTEIDELGVEFMYRFAFLVMFKAFHWLIEERVDYYGILALSLFSASVRYVLHTIDSMREHPWDKKITYLLYLDIVIGLARLLLYVDFTLIMRTIHPFPLFVVRPIYLSVRDFKKAIQDVLLSRQAIRYMNTVIRDATSEDLSASSDTLCIICREEMHVPGGGDNDTSSAAANANQQHNRSQVLKRLPCSHIFHINCLRSWFQRQQTCPTCRLDVIKLIRQQEQQNVAAANRGQNNNNPANPGSAAAANTPGAAAAGNQPGAVNRPPWAMLPGFQMPMYMPPPYMPPPNNNTSSGGQEHPPIPTTMPFGMSPFMGIPVIYPGNMLPTHSLPPMPEPPSGPLPDLEVANLRASTEAKLKALRQINVLLNAAILQMNAYLTAVTEPDVAESQETTAPSTSLIKTVPTQDGDPDAEVALSSSESVTVIASKEDDESETKKSDELAKTRECRLRNLETSAK